MNSSSNKSSFVYSSSQLSKYFGITIKGIEYYEEKGLITPKRVGCSKQRRFDLASTYQLFMAKYLRQAGLDLNETLNILNARNRKEVMSEFDTLLKSLEFKQKKIESIIAAIKHNVDLLEQINNGPFFNLENSPHFKRLFLREMDEPHISNQQQTVEYRQWNELMPITNASVKYNKEDVLSNDQRIEPEIGMLISNKNFKKFNLKTSARITDINSRLCLHTVLLGSSEGIECKKWLQSAIEYLEDNNLSLDGDIITSLLLVLDNEQAKIRYDEAWLPVSI